VAGSTLTLVHNWHLWYCAGASGRAHFGFEYSVKPVAPGVAWPQHKEIASKMNEWDEVEKLGFSIGDSSNHSNIA